MVAGFRRSLSLPGQSLGSSPTRRRGHHLRSTSLPCLSHPALSRVLDQIRSSSDHAGLDRIDRLLAALDDLLRLPHAHGALRRRPAWTDRLLDALLLLADAHGSFRSAAIALADLCAEARAAARRSDPTRIASAARSYRRTEKELIRVAAAVKGLARSTPPGQWEDAAEAEVAGILTEALAATASASVAVLSATAAAAAAAAAAMSKNSRPFWPMRRKASKREIEAVEEVPAPAIEGLEKGSGRVLRGLINIRVSLLNILTPAL